MFSRAKSLLTLRILMALLVLCGAMAQAQFNGPPPSTSGALNQPQTLTVDTSVLNPAPRDYILHQGDTIAIRIFGQGDYNPSVTIGTDGKASLPLIGVVSLDHKTVIEAEEIIADRLRGAGIFQDPQVDITVTAGPGANVTVIGEVRGTVPVVGPRSLLSVLATLGGLPESASHVITINRPGVAQPIVVDLGTDPTQSLAADISLFPGDTIVVARIGAVYLLGSFKTQGRIALSATSPTTLMEAMAIGGGMSSDALKSQMRLIRTVGNRRTVVKLDAQRVIYGKDPDPILQPNDILFMPNNTFKTLLSSGQLSSVLAIVSVALSTYAYIRAF